MAINTGRTMRGQNFAEALALAMQEARRSGTSANDLPVFIDIGYLLRIDKAEFDPGDNCRGCIGGQSIESYDPEVRVIADGCTCEPHPKIVIYSLDH
jgi:hypothetical protein